MLFAFASGNKSEEGVTWVKDRTQRRSVSREAKMLMNARAFLSYSRRSAGRQSVLLAKRWIRKMNPLGPAMTLALSHSNLNNILDMWIYMHEEMDMKSPMNDAGSASVCIGLMDPASGSFVRVRRCNRSKTSLTRFVPD